MRVKDHRGIQGQDVEDWETELGVFDGRMWGIERQNWDIGGQDLRALKGRI